MTDYEVYGYKLGNNGHEEQDWQVCYSLSDAKAEAKRMSKDGYEDVRIVKHGTAADGTEDEAIAFWDFINGRAVRTE